VPARGVERHRGVQHRDQRQARRAQRRQPVEPQHGHVGERHEGPAGQARTGRQRGGPRVGAIPKTPESGEPDDRPGGRQNVAERQPGDGPRQQPGRIPELDIGGPGHHLPQVGEPGVRAHAAHRGRQAEPAAPALALDHPAEGHVVDAGADDRRQSCGSFQCAGAHQHAPAGRGRRAGARRVHPRERVELREEVHERGDDDPLPSGSRPQQRHLGDQIPVVALGGADQGPQRTRLPGDIGVGEQHVPGPAAGGRYPGRGEPLGHGPHLPGPAGPQRRAGHHAQGPSRALRVGGRLTPEPGGGLGGAVRTAVVDQDDGQRAGVVLAEQRGQHGGQHRGLVAGRDDRHHVRPAGRLADGRREPLAGPPVPAVPDGQVGPHEGGHRARDAQRQHPGSLSQPGPDTALRTCRPASAAAMSPGRTCASPLSATP
jgi:hypothetical protein